MAAAEAAAAPGGGGDAGSFPDYMKLGEECKVFLETFREPSLDGSPSPLKYLSMIDEVRTGERVVLDIELDDVKLHGGEEFLKRVRDNARRFVELFSDAIDRILDSANALEQPSGHNSAVGEVLLQHRLAQMKEHARAGDEEPPTMADVRKMLPKAILRRYEVRLTPLSHDSVRRIRDVKAMQIGALVTIGGIVLRASDVKPSITVAAYSCDVCGYECYQEVKARSFLPLQRCISEECTANGAANSILSLQTKVCKFVKYQELRVQEKPEHVPVGHIPRTMTVLAHGETSRQVAAGDEVTIGGIFLPTPFTGFQAMRAGLTADTYLEAQRIVRVKKMERSGIDDDVAARIEAASADDPYTRLSRSIAPEIFGHEDVKKALLLQMVGGVTRQQRDGMRTRGDVNICLMGDPGVAKSQLLKHVHKMAPRCVYTTGKGSSGVGLTAAVVKDPMTGEMTLEGGALVLADMGICCIDEFDKMEEADRTAIHEVMEQQTVSIAKAGITTTLNARTAILAAANPKYGRYNRYADADPSAALLKNINLPAALLSRFDLMFLLLDEVDAEKDGSLAAHITFVHQKERHPPLDIEAVPPAFIRQYIAVCKHITPYVKPELADYIAEAYVEMRSKDRQDAAATHSRGSITARQLLSILRLAEARAKLEMREEVSQADVDEAIRLIRMSQASVRESESAGDRSGRMDVITRIWEMLRGMLAAQKRVSMEDARAVVTRGGFSEEQFQQMLAEYEDLALLSVNVSRTAIDLVDDEPLRA